MRAIVNLQEIEREILDLEKKDTTYAVCERLAWLYVVRDHLKVEMVEEKKKAGHTGDSAFLMACEGVEIGALLKVMDQHMEAVRVIYPKEYSAVVEKIKGIME